MNKSVLSFLPFVLLGGVSLPVQADSLLGIIGDGDSGALVTLGSGDASNSGLVNAGVGGENQLLDVQVGGETDVVNATVGSGGGNLLDADVDLLNGTVGVDATVGGDSLANVGVNIGGNGGGSAGGGGGTGGNGNGGGGSGGGSGGNGGGGDGSDGNGGGGGNGGNGGGGGGGPILSSSGNGNNAVCSGTSPREVERLIRNTSVGANWQGASNVQIRRVDLCPEVQTWLASALTSTGLGPSLRSAIQSDALLSASIGRSSYSVDRVFAVQNRGNQLTLFVY